MICMMLLRCFALIYKVQLELPVPGCNLIQQTQSEWVVREGALEKSE